MSEIYIENCRRSVIKKIDNWHRQGLSYSQIAKKLGYWHHRTINRYHRVYEKYGETVFAQDKR